MYAEEKNTRIKTANAQGIELHTLHLLTQI